MDDRDRGRRPRLHQCGGARTDHLTADLIPASALEETGFVRAVFTTRRGGVSRGAYDSLNLSSAVGDDPEAVTVNRRRLADAVGMSLGALVEAEQVHGSAVALAGRGGGPPMPPPGAPIPGVDALVTADPGLWLAIYAADCVPVLVLDPATPAIAAVHAGWRGAAAGMVPAAFDRMRTAFGTAAAQCRVVLGPAIGGCCYEVDAPVARAMEGAAWWPEAARPTGPGRWHLDLRTAIRRQLVDLGVPADHVTIVPHCTACRADLFFSYRRDGVTGRMGACIGLRR
ncbi:MAG TPA: peptidoglycan editing factor PgeF [bacterium]|nr:peptidoglycan editing factor PgeF [bacterium]